jgi:hypothetical protein
MKSEKWGRSQGLQEELESASSLAPPGSALRGNLRSGSECTAVLHSRPFFFSKNFHFSLFIFHFDFYTLSPSQPQR